MRAPEGNDTFLRGVGSRGSLARELPRSSGVLAALAGSVLGCGGGVCRRGYRKTVWVQAYVEAAQLRMPWSMSDGYTQGGRVAWHSERVTKNG